MMEYLQGTLISASPLKTVVEVHGIGYRLALPLSHYSKLPQIGRPVLLYISTVIREDSHRHYGFLTLGERDLFEVLIEVSGIGPKTALALIGHLEATYLQQAISQSNLALLCKVPGIGRKTAERLIVEMKDKILKTFSSVSQIPGEKETASDALSALINLGYQPMQAQKAIKTAEELAEHELALPELITRALQHI